jgi:signal transduction histidine kinase
MILPNRGLMSALRRLVTEFEQTTGIQVSAKFEILNDSQYSGHIFVYRILHEALTNIAKHSRATEVTLSAKRKGGRLYFEVRDNGKGMNVSDVYAARDTSERGLGLLVMEERVRALKGSLKITSKTGGGTLVSFSIPIESGGEHVSDRNRR